MTKEKWFNPQSHSGWKETQGAEVRRRKVLSSVPKSKSKHSRYLSAARKIGALCNVTQDPGTKKKACADAQYFYRKARSAKK